MKKICWGDAFSPTPEAFTRRIDETLGRVSEMKNKRHIKLRTTLIAAAVLLLLMTGVAFATGLINSIFASMAGKNAYEPTVDYQALQELADDGAYQAEAVFEGADAPMRVEIAESYYDGEQLMLGLRFNAPYRKAVMGFGSNDPMFGNLIKTDFSTDELKRELTEAEYARFDESLQKDGRAGAIVYRYELSSDLRMQDGTELPASFSPDAMDNETIRRGENETYVEALTPLPDAAREKESLPLRLTVYEQPIYYYIDQTGAYATAEQISPRDIDFTIPRSEASASRHTAQAAFDGYTAKASLIKTGVSTRVTVSLSDAEIWDRSWEGQEGHIENYQLLCGDTMITGALLYWTGEEKGPWESGDDFSGTFAVLPEGAKTATLRPVYRVRDASGHLTSQPRAEEDIVFDLTKKATAAPAPAPTLKPEKRSDDLPVGEQELIEKAQGIFRDFGMLSEEATKDAVKWQTGFGFIRGVKGDCPTVSAHGPVPGASKDDVPGRVFYSMIFDPKTLKVLSAEGMILGAGRTNGALTYGAAKGGAMTEEQLNALTRNWDKILEEDRWTKLAEDFLRDHIVPEGAKLTHIKNETSGGNYLGYALHYVGVRFKTPKGVIHEVGIDPDTMEIKRYDRVINNR